ncbi:hypothetical protein HKX48_004218 [Thoreauomyces humboldtii]|nr:hypothetical protein HKX48_004218 [Thoreauomyces humboldtii]
MSTIDNVYIKRERDRELSDDSSIEEPRDSAIQRAILLRLIANYRPHQGQWLAVPDILGGLGSTQLAPSLSELRGALDRLSMHGYVSLHGFDDARSEHSEMESVALSPRLTSSVDSAIRRKHNASILDKVINSAVERTAGDVRHTRIKQEPQGIEVIIPIVRKKRPTSASKKVKLEATPTSRRSNKDIDHNATVKRPRGRPVGSTKKTDAPKPVRRRSSGTVSAEPISTRKNKSERAPKANAVVDATPTASRKRTRAAAPEDDDVVVPFTKRAKRSAPASTATAAVPRKIKAPKKRLAVDDPMDEDIPSIFDESLGLWDSLKMGCTIM